MTAIQKAREALVARITEYLSLGGLFNPEMMPQGPARDLLIDCRDALAALDAETEVKVRELEWIEGKATYPFYTASALKLFYVIRTGGAAMDGKFSVDVDGRTLKTGGFENLEAAKAAAQADYDRRIRSALVTPESRS